MAGWKFIDDNATFELPDPQRTSYLYFPLVNEGGMMSVITPVLQGDVKTGQHTFLTPPVSVEDLHNSRSGRNFWVTVDVGAHGAPPLPWSAMGASAAQSAAAAPSAAPAEAEQTTLRAGLLWQQVSRENPALGLRAEVTSFVPAGSDTVELLRLRLTNISEREICFIPTAAIPIYGRSADNLRDHRHVTSLLQRTRCVEHGVWVRPTLSFDERGHRPNQVTYAVLGAEEDGTPPQGFFPVIEDFIGEGGALDWPQAVAWPVDGHVPAGSAQVSQAVDGYEALGGLRFRQASLAPGASRSYLLILAVDHGPLAAPDAYEGWRALVAAYGRAGHFEAALARTQVWWQEKATALLCQTADARFDGWLKWVTIQPTLRRLFGNSFLPYHDYGRGGRGWRDLWQDILALLLVESGQVDGLLFGNFAGVRLDGSNATIIGSQPGEFKADRNNIPRVWMDHGAWPWLTTRLYIDQTGDLAFLLRQQDYFKDQHIRRAQAHDMQWDASQGTQQRTADGAVYQGTILEHFLVQHLTAFFNVGEHNNLRLEGADWNDGMDMARQRGESVAFTALYALNLRQLSQAALDLQAAGYGELKLMAELRPLLDTLGEGVDYASPAAKQARLQRYFEGVAHAVSGQQVGVSAGALAADLQAKADWLYAHIRQNEWIDGGSVGAHGALPGDPGARLGWFNGYYDDDGQRLEGFANGQARMTLTGQVFTLMSGIASHEQALQLQSAADRYLFDARIGGYRLNTDFGAVLMNMGRCFGFAFGHKENGAMFSHMAVMYAYALYQRGFPRQAWHVLELLYQHSADFAASRMYPGIPEYFSQRGRGMYPYLTGSASWYLLTLVTQSFGVRGQGGDLLLAPCLVRQQFDAASQAALTTLFAGRCLRIIYHNPANLDAGEYRLQRLSLDGVPLAVTALEGGCLVSRRALTALSEADLHTIEVYLAAK